MKPILYEKNETAFVNNGLGRLNDCISCAVTEERNGVYECDFEYPIGGDHYEDILIGRTIAVTHDDTGDIQPFDIVGLTRPIDGVVTYHCVHISYRQNYIVVSPDKNSWDSTNMVWYTCKYGSVPPSPFNYSSDEHIYGYCACADGLAHSIRQMLGGMEGSVLDTYGGEFIFDKWDVRLVRARGTTRDFTIRYGVNMLEYNDEIDSTNAYSSCVPYWANGDDIVVGTRITGQGTTPTGRGECLPLDLTNKFKTKPTVAQMNTEARKYMSNNQTHIPVQTISVSFLRIQDTPEYEQFINLLTCQLCDTIRVVFPDYDTSTYFKIVKTTWDVLGERYTEMELGSLSTTLAEAMGDNISPDRTPSAFSSVTISGDLAVTGNINGLYKIVDLAVSIPVVSAHAQEYIGTVTVPTADRPDGMSLVGIVGVGMNNYRVVPYNYYVNGANSITLAVVNTTANNSVAATMTFKLLYMRATSA
jgi:phage-related protein